MNSPRVLIIEDDEDIARLLALRLRGESYEPSVARDAVTAVTVARRERPDVILLDIGLPGGDGLMVLQRLKALQPFALIPVIVISAREPIAASRDALEAGATAFFAKPLDMDALLAEVAQHVGR